MVQCENILKFNTSNVEVKVGVVEGHFVICGCMVKSPYTAYNFFNDIEGIPNAVHDYICEHQDEINNHLYAISINDIYAKYKIQNVLDGIKYKVVK